MKEKIKTNNLIKFLKISLFILIFIFFNFLNTNVKAVNKNNLNFTEIQLNYKQYIENNTYTIKNLYNKNLSQPLNYPKKSVIIRYNKQKIILKNEANYTIGYIKEKESKYEINQDTLKIIKTKLNNEYLRKDNYKINFNSFSQSLEGVLFNKKILSNNNFSLSLTNKLLFGNQLIQRNYKGKAYKENNELIIEGFNDGINSDINHLSEEKNDNFNSYGYSFGFKTNYNLKKNFHLNFSAKNLLSKIYWNNIYTNVSEINTDNIIINEKGYKEYIASKKGNSYYANYITNLTPEYDFNINYQNYEAGFFYKDNFYPYLNYNFHDFPIISIGIWKDLYSFKIKSKKINLLFKTNDFKISKITTASFNFSLNFNF